MNRDASSKSSSDSEEGMATRPAERGAHELARGAVSFAIARAPPVKQTHITQTYRRSAWRRSSAFFRYISENACCRARKESRGSGGAAACRCRPAVGDVGGLPWRGIEVDGLSGVRAAAGVGEAGGSCSGLGMDAGGMRTGRCCSAIACSGAGGCGVGDDEQFEPLRRRGVIAGAVADCRQKASEFFGS